MTDQRKQEWYAKIKEASAIWFEVHPDYNAAFNYYDSAEVTIPNDPEYYRVPMAMWMEYHNELYDVIT